ncbi:MAG: hypothetical protein KTR24_12790, partial [Saprospiraceae bacterium]|nr:hypothetical protein [Saprospiraceae bacterium]
MRSRRLIICFVVYLLVSCQEAEHFDLPSSIDFNYHVRPILSDRCFSCHGPDQAAREADLRLDQEESYEYVTSTGRPVITPGRPKESEAIRRILSSDPEMLMPPPTSHLS